MCSHSPPVGEANNCESVIEMGTYIDAAPVCFLGWQPSAPSLRGVHSNAFVIIIRSAFFSSTQIYNWTNDLLFLYEKSVITFSSFAIPSGRWLNFSVNTVYLTVPRSFGGLMINSLPCDIHTRDKGLRGPFRRHKNQLPSL